MYIYPVIAIEYFYCLERKMIVFMGDGNTKYPHQHNSYFTGDPSKLKQQAESLMGI